VLPHSDWPELPYLETIQEPAQAEAKYVRTSRGPHEYAHVVLGLEPQPRGAGAKFESIAGAAVPERYVPAIRSAVAEAQLKGPLLGAEMTDFLALLTNGSYHESDSNAHAFSIATKQAFEKASKLANPVLLEPVMTSLLALPEEFVGAIIEELTKRRGEIKGMEAKKSVCEVQASLPLSETAAVTRFLSAITFGRGKISLEFSHYEKSPRQMPPGALAVADYT
jgi:elongation factor G